MDSLPSSTPAAPRTPSGQPAWESPCTVNDLHSQLNRTPVAAVARPGSVAELQQAIRDARDRRLPVAVCGGRHAMGGQQFCRGGLLVDTTGLGRVIDFDRERGLVTVEAGIQWPALVAHLAWAGAGEPSAWGIVQKQTGADRLSIGGALAANIHGRGLRLPPIVADVESFDLVDAAGALLHCSRDSNPELFGLAIGGYGLFGIIARVTLRLARRHKVERRVSIERLDDLPELFAQRIREGCEFGDFQFATDPDSPEFLQAGVFSCYRPVDDDRAIAGAQHQLTAGDWRRLILLAHTSKSRAFEEYARYYLSTDRHVYWSDTHQMAEYLDGYHADLDVHLAAPVKGTEMISEIYAPRHRLPALMDAVRRVDLGRCWRGRASGGRAWCSTCTWSTRRRGSRWRPRTSGGSSTAPSSTRGAST
jgi:FAD/FMN-containing dehydrogenase